MTGPSAGNRHVTVYTRVDCHLCEVAMAQVLAITAETGATYQQVDVDADPDDRAEYGDRVPVILVDGIEHGYYRVEPDRLRRALARKIVSGKNGQTRSTGQLAPDDFVAGDYERP